MKNAISLLFIGVLLLSGCATTQVQDTLPYVKLASNITARTVLAVVLHNPDQRELLRNDMYAAALGVRTLTGGQAPTVGELKLIFHQFAPNLEQFVDLATPLGQFYADFFPRVDGDAKLAFQVLESIAEGVEQAAANISQDGQPGFVPAYPVATP